MIFYHFTRDQAKEVTETLFINGFLRYSGPNDSHLRRKTVIMVSRIIIFALIAGVVYLHYTTPKIEDHKAFLLKEMQIGFAPSEEQLEKIWKKTDFANFFVCSFIKETESSTMISYGFLKKVRLADDNWAAENRAAILQRSNY